MVGQYINPSGLILLCTKAAFTAATYPKFFGASAQNDFYTALTNIAVTEVKPTIGETYTEFAERLQKSFTDVLETAYGVGCVSYSKNFEITEDGSDLMLDVGIITLTTRANAFLPAQTSYNSTVVNYGFLTLFKQSGTSSDWIYGSFIGSYADGIPTPSYQGSVNAFDGSTWVQ